MEIIVSLLGLATILFLTFKISNRINNSHNKTTKTEDQPTQTKRLLQDYDDEKELAQALLDYDVEKQEIVSPPKPDTVGEHIVNKGGNEAGIYYDDDDNDFSACELNDDYTEALARRKQYEQQKQEEAQHSDYPIKAQQRMVKDEIMPRCMDPHIPTQEWINLILQLIKLDESPAHLNYFTQVQDILAARTDIIDRLPKSFYQDINNDPTTRIDKLFRNFFFHARMNRIEQLCQRPDLTMQEFEQLMTEATTLLVYEKWDITFWTIGAIMCKRADLMAQLPQSNPQLHITLKNIKRESDLLFDEKLNGYGRFIPTYFTPATE